MKLINRLNRCYIWLLGLHMPMLPMMITYVPGINSPRLRCRNHERPIVSAIFTALLSATKSQHQMECALLLNVIIGQRTAILQLLSSKDESLLVWWNTLLVLDLALDVVNGIARFHFKCNSLSRQSLDEDLHSTTETKDQVESRLLLNVVVRKCSAVFQLLSGENETLLIRWDALLVLDLRFYVIDGIRRLDLKSDGLASEGLDD
jgi:hypothetical protein